MTSCLGIDTSNYTTSAAVYRTDGTGCNSSRLLNVEHGGMGLRAERRPVPACEAAAGTL